MKTIPVLHRRSMIICACFLLVALFLTACGEMVNYADAVDAVEYTEEDYLLFEKYAGSYYSGVDDARVYFLYESGKYELLGVQSGGDGDALFIAEGYFKPLESEGMIDFGYMQDGEFIVRDSLYLYPDGISEGNCDFIKLTDAEGFFDTIAKLTDMTVPFVAYIGEWESESQFTRITISEERYMIATGGSFSGGIIQKGRDHLVVTWFKETLKLQATEDGSLILEGREGKFYPAGDERLKNAPHKAFVGYWHNETTQEEIMFSDDGSYSVMRGNMNEDGTVNFGISTGYYEVNDGILTYTYEDIEHTAVLNDGVMTMSGIDGVFKRS